MRDAGYASAAQAAEGSEDADRPRSHEGTEDARRVEAVGRRNLPYLTPTVSIDAAWA